MKVIDVHTHGIGGYDTRTTDEDHILAIAAAHGSLGVDEILPAIYSASIKVMREQMAVVRKAMEKQTKAVERRTTPKSLTTFRGPRRASNHPKKSYDFSGTPAGVERNENQDTTDGSMPARISGIHLEGPFLNFSQCGALNAATFLEPSEYHLQELVEGFEDIVKIITIAPELQGAENIIRKIADMGFIPSMGHSEATYNEAEIAFNAGACGITHIFNAMRRFHHREPGLAGFGLLNGEVYIEVIADPYHLHMASIELIFRIKNPSRIIIISDSVKESKTYKHIKGVTDSSGTLLGGSTSIPESAAELIQKGLDEELVMNCITKNPERYLTSR